MPKVNLPDGRVVNFPDSMTPDQIGAALRGMSGPQGNAQQMGDSGATWGGVQNFASGALQGWGDELSAATAAAKESLSGGLPFGKAYDQALPMYRGARQQYATENPGEAMATEIGGSLAGLAAGGVGLAGAMGRGIPMAASAGGRALQSGAVGAAQGAQYGFAEGQGGVADRASSGAIGGALGGVGGVAAPAIGGAVSKVISPVKSSLGGEGARLAGIAENIGMKLSPAQKTGSRSLANLESVFRELPFTAPVEEASRNSQSKAFNRAVLDRAGIDAEDASPEVMRKAKERFGRMFENTFDGVDVKLDDQALDALATVQSEYAQLLPTAQKSAFENTIDDVLKNNGVMTGKQYQKARAWLGKRAESARMSDPEFAGAMKGLQRALDDVAARSVPSDKAAEFSGLRSQYEAFKQIENAMKSTTGQALEGSIPATRLLQQTQKRAGGTSGAGPLNDLARVGGMFVRDPVANSGTAQRQYFQNLITGSGLAGVGAGGAAYGGADPATAALIGGAAIGGPRLAQMLYNSAPARAYLTNQVAGRVAPQNVRNYGRLAAALASGTAAGRDK